ACILTLQQRGDEDGEGKLELICLVLRHMIHLPCASSNLPCQNGKGFRTKGFPKSFNEYTYVAANGYAQLKRQSDEEPVLLSDGRTVVSNREVVQHPRYLLKRFDTLVNVEHWVSLEAIKYIFMQMFR
uniref:Uncharacterized protein n=1 Tax=Parascaris univalens TaxID=6257 RepID=A0A915B1Q1_PARUN